MAVNGTKVKTIASKRKAMNHERMLKAKKELEREINALMRRAEILDAKEDQRYGKGKRGREQPDELQRQGRKGMAAETAVAAARQRQQAAAEAKAKATRAPEADAPAAELAELSKKADAGASKAKAAREKAIAAAEDTGLDPPDLEPLAAETMPRRGM